MKRKPSVFYILSIVFMCSFLVFSFVLSLSEAGGILFVKDNQMSYEVTTEERVANITDIKVIKEKDKEDVYCLSLSGVSPNKVEIPAQIYKKFIGEGNNAFTYLRSILTFYVPQPKHFAPSTQVRTFSAKKDVLPWQGDEAGFWAEDVEEMRNAIVASNGSDVFSSLSFTFHNVDTGETEITSLSENAKPWVGITAQTDLFVVSIRDYLSKKYDGDFTVEQCRIRFNGAAGDYFTAVCKGVDEKETFNVYGRSGETILSETILVDNKPFNIYDERFRIVLNVPSAQE